MPDQGFREVQLGGKQVVFLFMAVSVALIGTFLLGVSVGKGVTIPDPAAQATPTPVETATEIPTTAPLPPATTPAPGDLDYHKTSKDSGNATAQLPAAAAPVTTPTPTAAPVVKPAAPTSTPAPKAAPPAATAVWYVQVNSFSTNANALKEVSELKKKDVTAKVLNAPGSGAHYKVRVGPMDREAADALVLRLRKQGYSPRVTR